MDRRDVNRWIAYAISEREYRNKCLYGNDAPVEEIDISLATMAQLRAISDAVDVPMTVGMQDSDANPLTREVIYQGARFWVRQEGAW